MRRVFSTFPTSGVVETSHMFIISSSLCQAFVMWKGANRCKHLVNTIAITCFSHSVSNNKSNICKKQLSANNNCSFWKYFHTQGGAGPSRKPPPGILWNKINNYAYFHPVYNPVITTNIRACHSLLRVFFPTTWRLKQGGSYAHLPLSHQLMLHGRTVKHKK